MIKDNFFSYYWYLDEKEQEVTSIRIYGLNEKNENVCLRIEDFLPYVYIELPTNFPWTPTRAQMVGNKIDQIIPKNKPITKTFCMKYRLYGVQLDEKGQRKKFPYLKCTFSHRDDIRKLGYALKKPIPISGMGNLHLKMHEQDADPILQFVCNKDIPTAGWFTFKGDLVGESEKITICDKEYLVKTRNIAKYDKTIVAKPKIMGFDIEVNSTNPFAMPKPEKPGDKVFQISCVFAREGCSEKDYDMYLLTLGEPDHSIVGNNVTIYMYDTEYELLEGFTELVREENPNVIVGYNILAFDINYMIERAKREFCGSFYKLGFHKYNNAKEKTIKWSSSAYKNQEFQFLDAEGRIFVDLLPLIRRDYKFNNYQLKTVSMEILKDTKDDLSHTGIFKCYRIGTKKEADGTYSKKAKKAMGICGKYCFPENTKISTLHGNIPIKNLIKNTNLLSWDENSDNIIISEQINFFNNGDHDCIELEFEDGRKLECTPDHLIAMQNNEWVEAKNINIGDIVKIGLILPDKEIDTDDMILSRLIGYLVTDGHICKDRCTLFVGTLFDCNVIIDDIKKLTNITKNIRYGKNCMEIDLPPVLSKKIKNMKGIKTGNRTKNINYGLPDTSLWNKDCIKEFLGGIFGGDGWSTSLSRKEKKFTTIGLSQSRYDKESLITFMNIIKILLNKFNIESTFIISEREKLYIGKLTISIKYLEQFMTTIGYRYCYHKTIRSSCALIYFRIRDRVRNYSKKLYEEVIELRKNNKLSIKKAYDISLSHNEYSHYMPKYDTIKQWIRKGFPSIRNDKISSKFPKADFFIKNMGAENFFKFKDKFRHTYSMTKDQNFLPTLKLKVVNIKNTGKKTVYDLEVKDTHSFLAEGVIVHNCLKDSILVVKLMEKMQTWVGLTEQASTYNTSIFSIYTQGQQIKVYSQVYKYCLYNDIVVEKDGYKTKEDERYVGAHVFPPIPGLYERVLPFDFSSLYPTTIIAYNIDYSTIVWDNSIPDSLCNVFTWSDHISCIHDPKVIRKNALSAYIEDQQKKLKELREKRDKIKKDKKTKELVQEEINKITEEMKPYREERAQIAKTISKNPMCAERNYRFLKEPKGVIPTILQNLLDARKNTRKNIKNSICKTEDCKGIAQYGLDTSEKPIHCLKHKEENEIEFISSEKANDVKLLNNVLDKRQLAYKISANSMYGAMGVKKGYLPFMPGAMVTCFMGRTNIQIVASTIQEKYGGKLVYGDTDSNYISFPHLKTAQESWDYAEHVAAEVSKLFPKPISLAFEEAIYWQFFILTKKRYMYRACGRNGIVDKKIGKKGVLLARRDNASLIRTIYEKVIGMIFDHVSRDDILYYLIDQMNKICSNSIEYKEYIITKAVGDTNNMMLEPIPEEKGKANIGNYKVSILPKSGTEREKQLKLKDAENEEEYYKKCLPAVVQLAEKMRNRGQRVDNGSRLEYVIIDNGIKNDKQYNKLESYDYYVSHSDVLKIDFLYYIKLLVNPIDQLINVAFDNEESNSKNKYKYKKDFLLNQYDYRNKVRGKVMEQIKTIFKPEIKFN